MIYQPKTIEEAQQIIRNSGCILPRGGGTKPALSTPDAGTDGIEMKGLSGIIEYQPEEYTFTAYAGTSIGEVNGVLKSYGQFLPFDPPLAGRGATLGGTVAAGLSGPGRYRSGGVRDFLLGVHFVDGKGASVRGGGKVVKNAAGFDLPKLMVGSLGRLGVMVELTFKVFPSPAAFTTFQLTCSDLDQALRAIQQASLAKVDLEALDLVPLQKGYQLWARLSGMEITLPPRVQRLEKVLGGGTAVQSELEPDFWHTGREFTWVPDGWSLVKLPLTPGKIPLLEARLSGTSSLRRYSAGGQVAWIAIERSPELLANWVGEIGSNALSLWGPPGVIRIGEQKGRSFYTRIQSVLDPDHHFAEV